jgi:hypothetical protein
LAGVPITPDTKDWTWVLERPCPECDFDAGRFELADVGRLIRENATAWQDVLRRPAAELTTRPAHDRWSTLEYACHVRDVFRLYDERLGLMLTQDGAHFLNWDQDVTAVEERYNQQDPAEVAEALTAAAAALADHFGTVAGDQWQRTGIRSDGAHFTVESFARYFIHDPVHHLRDVGAP